jgi:bacteriocin-like protein
MTHEVQAHQLAARDAQTLTESELDTVSGGDVYADNADFCARAAAFNRTKNVWNYLVGLYT